MKMPATTNTKVEAKPSTELIGDAAKQCLNCLEKKVRNLEKRKGKIELNREKAEKGTKLEKEQEVSLCQYEQVTHDLEFAKELHKQFQTIYSEHEKMVKKQAKREKAERQAVEIRRVSQILQLQSTLDLLGGDTVREDFKTGKHGAVVLTEDNLDQLDQLYQAISPSRDDSGDEYPQKLTAAAEHLVNILDGKDRQVMGTTYKELKELLALITGCGYFENAKQSAVEEGEAEAGETGGADEQSNEDQPAADSLSLQAGSEDTQDDDTDSTTQTPAQPEQQPMDLTTNATTEGVQSHLDLPTQPMNTLEQDAFFAPSSTAYQSEGHFSSQQQQQQATNPSQAPDFQSFTNNRPFQFIQASYIADPQQAPSVVDPAVIHAQPAATGSNLQFMSAAAYDTSTLSQNSAPQPSQQPSQSQAASGLGMGELSQALPQTSNAGSITTQQAAPEAAHDYGSQQTYGQTTLQQSRQFPPAQSGGVVEEVGSSLGSHSGLMGQIRDESNSPYEIPPSIPMPPSQAQQDQTQDYHHHHHPHHQHQLDQQQLEEKKFQMNASAPVFQSMYNQGGAQVNVPPPSADQSAPVAGDFNAQNANTDFQQGYQGNQDFNYSRSGGRGGYRGSRNGSGPPGPRNGAPGTNGSMHQNGFSGRPNTNNGRGGRGGYSGYGGSNAYRQDNNYNTYNAGGFGSYQKRAGMNNAGGGPNMGNTGYNNRAGPGMRGGMPRGGQRGGMRPSYNRPPPNQ